MEQFVQQLTRKQAIALAKSGVWKDWDSDKIVRIQLFQDRLCMDAGDFHSALEDVLGREVFTHELGQSNIDNIRREYLGMRPAPTMQEILDLLPGSKRVVVCSDGE